jgi:hypothetical protein
MVVVTGIIMVLAAVLLVRNSAYGGSIILRSLAYDVALSFREAQTYGISVRQSNGTFSSGYGVEVRTGSPTDYLLYTDTDNTGFYSGSTELVNKYTLKSGYTIVDLCYTPAGGTSEVCGAQKLDVTFHRPEPDAYIRVNDLSALNQQGRIKLASPDGTVISIIIQATGQISVE